MQYHHQPYSGRGSRHTTYHSNRHRNRSATSSYNLTSYPSYYQQYFSTNQGNNPPPSKRRRAEPSTWQPDSFPRQIGESSSSGNTSRPREEEPGFLSRDQIERLSPSRKDGIDSLTEARLRNSYCSYLKNLGLRLALPQTTVATAIVLCHRFYLRRSLACHDRFLVATAALFLASKSEETPCLLNTVLRVSFEVSQNPEFAFVPYMFQGQNWFDQYRERVIEAEQLILMTLDFELEVKHPYGPLDSGLNKLGFSRTVLYNMAWNLVTEGPNIFKSSSVENNSCTKSSSNSDLSSNLQQSQSEDCEEESGSDEEDDDVLPPLEANTNRNRPFEVYSDSDSEY